MTEPSRVVRVVAWLAALAWIAWFGSEQVVSVAGSYHDLGLLDTQVYRMGGQAILDRAPLYDARYPHDALPFTYSPFAALLFVPLALAGWTGGAVAMTLASLAATARVAQLVVRRLGATNTWILPPAVVALCFVVALWPVRSTLEYGQVNLLVLWLVVEDLFGAGAGRRWSGALVGVAIGIKLTPFVFLGLLLWSGQRRRFATAVGSAAATVAVGFVVVPADAWAYWTSKLFDTSRVGDIDFVANQSIAGVVARVVGHPVTAVAGVGALGVLVLTSWLGARRWGRGREVEAIALVALGGLLVSPISWSHHWVWLFVVELALVARAVGEAGARRAVAVALLAVTVAAGAVRAQTVVSTGALPWRSPMVADWLFGNLFVLLGVALVGVALLDERRAADARADRSPRVAHVATPTSGANRA